MVRCGFTVAVNVASLLSVLLLLERFWRVKGLNVKVYLLM